MAVHWKTAALYAGVLLVAAVSGAGGVYVLMPSTVGATQARGSAHGASPAASGPLASAPRSSSGVTTPQEPTEPGTRNAPTVSATAAASQASTADEPSSAPAGTAVATTAHDGPVDVPRMAQDLGPFPSRLRSIACQPRHSGFSSNDPPKWVCSVTLDTEAMPYPVALDGPHDRLAIYTDTLFSSSYAFVYVPAHGDKAAHFSAVVDPKASPYRATMAWTNQVIAQAFAQAMEAEHQAQTQAPRQDTVGQRNADSWAAVGVR